MPTSTDVFDPAQAGLRVSAEPTIRRKPRRPSSRPQPEPQFAKALWFSFENGAALETEVPTRAVEDTVRALKRAARYLERTKSKAGHKVEVRVQIGVEAKIDEATGDPVKPARSVIKFLGHEPWLLGRRIAKQEAEPEAPAAGRHRRTVAGTRKTVKALSDALVRAVITTLRPSCLPSGGMGVLAF